jgi:hypothetical protein
MPRCTTSVSPPDSSSSRFRPPRDPRDALPGQPLGKAGRKGDAKPRPPRLGMRDFPALQRGLKAPADRLDFGQFGQI